jgi:hypothetical protein
MVDSLAVQLANILAPRVAELNTTVAPKVAMDIRDRALSNTREGRAFGNDEYKRTYAETTKRIPANKTHVDLRKERQRIDNMDVIVVGARTGAVIGWKDRGEERLFSWHHHGGGRLPIRRIFPTGIDQLPLEVKTNAQKLVKEALSGK